MAQEVVILSGIRGDSVVSMDGMQAVIRLQSAKEKILSFWAGAWELKATAHAQAVAAKSKGDRAAYDHAKSVDAESMRIMRRAAEEMKENDTLRGQLSGQLQGKVALTPAAKDWFSLPAGLPVPAKYDASKGGTPIPRFPEFS